jgi:hypothetical protein
VVAPPAAVVDRLEDVVDCTLRRNAEAEACSDP